MRLLDLFCGAGGAAMGYYRAGFTEIVGVDIKTQPRYPFEFNHADALDWFDRVRPCRFVGGSIDGAPHICDRCFRDHSSMGHSFAAIHASPPCQAFTALKSMWNAKEHADLIEPTRKRLRASGLPWVIENVPGAPLVRPIELCGTMFGLGVNNAELRRHRLFESNFEWGLVPPCAHYERGIVCGVYGGHGRDRRRIKPATVGVYGSAGGRSVRDGTQQFSTAERAKAMGIDWMRGDELSQAIPPAYTEFIGRQLMEHLAGSPEQAA